MDFRDLNKATPKDEYPMPVAETLINAAAGHKMMSFMDGNAGYNQIFMAPEDVNKTAFRVPGAVGLFEYLVTTFGLKNCCRPKPTGGQRRATRRAGRLLGR